LVVRTERRHGSEVVEDGLRHRIHAREFRPGDRIPTQAELSEQYGVPRGAVRRALERLDTDGIIQREGQGSRAVVAGGETVPRPQQPTAGPGETAGTGGAGGLPVLNSPRTAFKELTARVQLAFARRDDVTIDAYCLDGETLHHALSAAAAELSVTRTTLRSLRVRVLLANPRGALALPRNVTDPDDERPRRRLEETVRTYVSALGHALEMLRVRELVPEVTLLARMAAITPTQQVFVLNGEEALTGYYHLVPRTIELDGERLDIYDLHGLDGTLNRRSLIESPNSQIVQAHVRETQRWFDALWEHIASPLPPRRPSEADGPDAGPVPDTASTADAASTARTASTANTASLPPRSGPPGPAR
jgi:hypothetical protein